MSVPSPCNNICILDGTICTGCGRTTDEIARWSTMKEEEQRKIVLRVCPSLLDE
ncbi:MAG: DUF1289 domain-containing protein [Candidatus Iainarchaeum archaeon]|uniref:DUF1289 domain-containing protein n=1 Tax=Candidatus Iainarchaeum sp. TaxID=3101447 RepID=A0A7T9I1G4_9ARCH|nr:MAG: DUF1289 domain-containing protein [Candidatus Diapherotrites archaeon]